jgi:molybdate transport system ATP-binding protein
LLVQAICSDPELLVLDEPYEGLDADSCAALENILVEVANHRPVVLIVNRLSEIPGWITHTAVMSDSEISYAGPIDWQVIEQIMQLQSAPNAIPRAEQADRVPTLPPGPLVKMKQVRVAYGDEVIFSGLNWSVEPQQHWQVVGPNGSGKTCLLNLISGDHPQCYVNDVFVVGYQRGQGESIWDIKQHMGYVSSHLQMEYRVSINLQNVILSGFYDSIGLYEQATDDQIAVAKQWLSLLGLSARHDQPFNQCSYGEQKMLLIARAMVKHPQLLILDEPCLGLDEINRQLVLVLVEKICLSGETTVLYVNHHAEDKIKSIENVLDMAAFR